MYSQVNQSSKIALDLIDLINNTSEWYPYYNFMAIPVPGYILDQDPFIVSLAKKRKFQAGILKMEPYTCYNWHVDTDRHAALNMLVLGDDSKCIFCTGEFGVVMPIAELKYRKFAYYAFNTKIPHTVYNFSEPRYLFSLEFLDEDKGLTYDELCADIETLTSGNE